MIIKETVRIADGHLLHVIIKSGRSIYCWDRENMIQECKNPIAKQFLMDFCILIAKELSNLERDRYSDSSVSEQWL